MIIRKPYAFLIKNFKKIHIFLLVLSLYVAYKLIDVSSFVNEFMSLGVYDVYSNPITKHITFLFSIAVILLVVGSVALMFLLRHKGKPWKIYLVPVIEYLFLFFVLNMVKSFFAGYTNDIETTDLRMARDLLFIFLIVQLPAIGIFVMRVFGLDIQKFNFNSDQEFLELSEADREEIEISFSVDKNTIIRLFKKLIRNIKYFYLEHKGICRGLIVIFVILLGYNFYKLFFVTNKSYSEGELYSANGYSIKVNKTYFTDKDYKGDIIAKKSNFVVVDLTIKNNSSPRKINIDNFHLKNGVSDYTSTHQTYAKEFKDLGNTYKSVKELKRDETLNLIIVYRVDKNLKSNKFALYYQEIDNNNTLRKIKLKVNDISKIEEQDKLEIGDNFKLDIYKKEDTISFDYYELTDQIEYSIRSCSTVSCLVNNYSYSTNGGFKILRIEFGSDDYEAKNMIDFLTGYGKIEYKDDKGNLKSIDVESVITKNYFGKVLYLKVPNEIEVSSEIKLLFTVRNKKYIYKLV